LSIVGALAVVTACGGRSAASSPAVPPPPNAAAIVVMRNIAFVPQTVTIHVGQTVAWEFDDGTTAHNVTFPGFASPDRTSGYYSHTFTTPGTFPYQCTIHRGMDGTVIVTS
jgi:plastocyanin